MLKKINDFFFKNGSVKQTIVKNSFWLLVAEAISKISLVVLTIIIARYLGIEGYGQFSFAFAFVSLFAIFADFGLSTLAIREIARNTKLSGRYIRNISFIKLFLGILTFILIIIIIPLLGKSADVKMLVYLAGIWVILQSFIAFFQSVFRAFEKMQYEAISKAAYSFSLIGIAIAAIWLNLGINAIIQGYIYASLIALVITFILIRKNFMMPVGKIEFKFWKYAFKETWPFALSSIFVMIYFKIGSVMLSVMTSDSAVGLYNAAYTLAFALSFFSSIATMAVFPLFSRLYLKNKKLLAESYRKFLKLILLGGMIAAIGIFVFSKQIILLLFGQGYYDSVSVLKLLTWAQIFAYSGAAPIYLLASMNKQILETYAVFFGAVLNISLNLFLIPRYSYIGAGVATVVTEASVSILLYVLANRELKKLNLEADVK